MYEVEYKVEISEKERANLIALFEQNGFMKKQAVLQNDYYIEATESQHGGFDLKRYRDEGDRCFYTEKVWEDIDGHKARREAEKEVPRTELEREVALYPNMLKIQKTRQPFIGTYQGQEIHIDMDSVKFDHSQAMRYFIEAEVMSKDKESVKALKESVAEFLRQALGRSEIVESPGMFTMAFKKL